MMNSEAEAMTKYSKPLEVRRGRSKIIAAILAIFFGDLGFHKFLKRIILNDFSEPKKIKHFFCNFFAFNSSHYFPTVCLGKNV